jgi:hypothetical protein
MAETAAHLVDPAPPPLPVRQWVLALPKRLRYYTMTLKPSIPPCASYSMPKP